MLRDANSQPISKLEGWENRSMSNNLGCLNKDVIVQLKPNKDQDAKETVIDKQKETVDFFYEKVAEVIIKNE